MKDIHKAFILHLLCLAPLLCILSCVPGYTFSREGSLVDEAGLLLYTRSLDIYREGRFTEAAKMLGGEKKFVPSLILRGKAEYLSGDLAAAEVSLKKALALKPHDTEALLFLARLCRETGAGKEAQQLVEKILGDNPYELRALRLAADLSREKGVSGEAASAALLDRAVEASAESALVFFDRARLRWKGGNSGGALEDLNRARVLLPDGSPVLKGIEVLESIVREVSR